MATVRKVTAIPASIAKFSSAPIDQPVKRRVAGYARVSTDHDEQFTSYEAQIDYYTKYIKSREDWEFVNVYTDEGISGTSTRHREGFNSMIEDAMAGKIDLIVTKSVSRFARNTVDSLTTIRQLKEHGTECYFEKENIWTFDSKGELLITIMSSLAQEESRSISENVTWGHRKRFADGKVSLGYSHFLGYDKGPDGSLVINPQEAETVRKIFRLFLQGKTPYGIAKQLTEEGIPTPGQKKKWNSGTVKRILSNEKHKGDALLQKSFTVDFLSKKKKINEGEIPQYYVENDHEAIIDPAVFDEVQVLLEQRSGEKTYHSGVHGFSGKIKCGQCGSWYGSKVWHSNSKYRRIVWQCNHKYSNNEKCTTPHLYDEEIRTIFVRVANQVLKNRQQTIADFREITQTAFDTAALEQEKSELSEELNVVSDLIEQCIYDNSRTAQVQSDYQERYDRLAKRYEDAKSRLDEVTSDIRSKTSRHKAIENYLDLLEKSEDVLTEFDPKYWHGMVDFVTVYAADDIRFTFKDGTEIKA